MGQINSIAKQEIVKIQCRQVDEMESKLRYIAENYEEMIVQLRVKQAEELKKYALQDDSRHQAHYNLWRGGTMEFYVMGNLLKESNELTRDMKKRLEEGA